MKQKFESYGFERGNVSGYVFEYETNKCMHLNGFDYLPVYTTTLEDFRKNSNLCFTFECERNELSYKLLTKEFHKTYPEVLL